MFIILRIKQLVFLASLEWSETHFGDKNIALLSWHTIQQQNIQVNCNTAIISIIIFLMRTHYKSLSIMMKKQKCPANIITVTLFLWIPVIQVKLPIKLMRYLRISDMFSPLLMKYWSIYPFKHVVPFLKLFLYSVVSSWTCHIWWKWPGVFKLGAGNSCTWKKKSSL